jgi:sporulation protein YlmC with PRC-barrel domain
MEQVRMQGDRLVITGRTDDQLRALPAFTQAPTGYRQATGTMAVPVLVTSAAVGGAAVGAPAATGTAATGTAAAGAATAGRANTRAMAASQLVDMDVYNLRGEQLGDVKRVMMGSGNQLYIIIGHGGFLGLGEKEILLPMERVQLRDDRLVVQGIDDDSIRRMPAFNAGTAGGYREVERTFNTSVPLYAN